jgi:peptidoglycan/LPS O-acetylase OafA/YrhL
MTYKQYRPEIDGLRAIAVLSVILYHAGIGPVTGYAGVDVFFVISGYLITWLLVKEKKGSGRIDLLGFYARRVRRILPAVSVVILFTLYLSCISLSPIEQSKTFHSAVSSILFCANFFFLRNSGGYFDSPSEEMPFLHLWSLSVEEQFYLVWPLLIMFLIWFRPKLLKVFLAILIVASLLFAEYQIWKNPEMAYFLMPARFWELAIGGFVATTSKRTANTKYAGIAGLIAIGIGLTFPINHFPGIGALPVVVGTAFLLWRIHVEESLGMVGSILSYGPLTYVGRISYSLYLWHWPLFAIYRAVNIDTSKPIFLLLCGVAFVMASLSYRYVETPFRKSRISIRSERVIACSVIASSALAIVVFAFDNFVIDSEDAVIREVDYATKVENDQTPFRAGCKLSAIAPANKFPPAGCESLRGVSPRVAVWGDSFGTVWQPLAWAIAEKLNLSAADYTRYGCPAFVSDFASKTLYRDGVCHEYNLNVVEKIKGFDTLVIGTRWDFRSIAIDEEGIRATLNMVSPLVRKVYVLGPTPVMRDRLPKCIRANKLEACAIPRSEFDRKSEPIRAVLKALSSKYKNVEYIELADFLCTPAQCFPVKDGVALYYDDSHISYSAAKKFTIDFIAHAKL